MSIDNLAAEAYIKAPYGDELYPPMDRPLFSLSPYSYYGGYTPQFRGETPKDAFISTKEEGGGKLPVNWKTILAGSGAAALAIFTGVKISAWNKAKKAARLAELKAAKKSGMIKGAAIAGGIAVLLAGAYAFFTSRQKNAQSNQYQSEVRPVEEPSSVHSQNEVVEEEVVA